MHAHTHTHTNIYVHIMKISIICIVVSGLMLRNRIDKRISRSRVLHEETSNTCTKRSKISHRKQLTANQCSHKTNSTKYFQTKYVVLKIVQFPFSSKMTTKFPYLKHKKCHQRSNLFQTSKRCPSHNRNARCTKRTDHEIQGVCTIQIRGISSRSNKQRRMDTNHVHDKYVSTPCRDHTCIPVCVRVK